MLNKIFFGLLCLLGAHATMDAQSRFTNCTAAFLDNKMIVDDYSPSGKCVLSATSKGLISVATVQLSAESSLPEDRLSFMVAIRDGNTHTLMMYSRKVYKEVEISDILARCQKGDAIVLLTMDDEYAMPHNEILIQ
jgi:hypothetical protein